MPNDDLEEGDSADTGPPDFAVELAREALDRKLRDSALAELVQDSLLDGGDPAEHHSLEFRLDDTFIEVLVEGDHGARHLTVESSLGLTDVRLESPSWSEDMRAYDGRTFAAVPSATVRVRAVDADDRRVHTDWFRI